MRFDSVVKGNLFPLNTNHRYPYSTHTGREKENELSLKQQQQQQQCSPFDSRTIGLNRLIKGFQWVKSTGKKNPINGMEAPKEN